MIVLSCVQFNAISVINSSSLMTRGERSILNFDPRCFCSLMPPPMRVLCSRVFLTSSPVLKGGIHGPRGLVVQGRFPLMASSP